MEEAAGGAGMEESVLGEQEFEVENILRYRRNEDGAEYFLVKWVGYSTDEATWEPLEHMNDNCRELIAKARALFAWRRPGGQLNQNTPPPAPAPPPAPPPQALAELAAADTVPEEFVAVMAEESASPTGSGGREEESFGLQHQAPATSGAVQSGEDDDILIEDGDSAPFENDTGYVDTAPPNSLKRRAEAVFGQQGPDSAAGAVPSKRPRVQPSTIPNQGGGGQSWDALAAASRQGVIPAAANGAPRLRPPAPPPPPTPPSTPPTQGLAPQKPTQMKCICGASEKLGPNHNRQNLVACKVCNFALHVQCVDKALLAAQGEDFVCPPCRLERVDEFHPPVGSGLLQHSYASCSSTFSLSFNSSAAQWRKQQWAVHLRAVQLNSPELSGPAWPHKVQGKLNGRQCVAIDPPKHLHVRREQCYNLTPLLKPGPNVLELRFSPKPDKPRDEAEKTYCVGVVLTRPRSVASIIARIRSRSAETVSSGRSRVEKLLAQVAEQETGQDECKVTGNFGRTLKPLCPMSHCPIEEAAIGKVCNHVQVFDLQAYIAVNQRMRSLDKRWTCPVCSLCLRPDDVILDPFAQGILDTLRGDEDLVEAIVFNEDCTWTTVSAVKEDKQMQDDEGQTNAGGPAELIDLSDSE